MRTNFLSSGRNSTSTTARDRISSIFLGALDAVDPYLCIKNSLHLLNRKTLSVTDCLSSTSSELYLDNYNSIKVVGCGKAGAPMAAAIEDLLGDRIKEGVVTVKRGYLQSKKLIRIAITEAGHPMPNSHSVTAAAKVYSLLGNSRENDLVIALLSGGGSSLWTFPVDSVTLDDIIALNRILLGCGASIGEVNTIRKQISRIKGGKAAQAAFPACVLVLALSDVIGNELSTIASGPFFYENPAPQIALQVIDKYGIRERIPESILQYLHNSLHNINKERYDSSRFQHVTYCICADNKMFLTAAASFAKQLLKYRVTILDKTSCGEASKAAINFIKSVKKIYDSFPNEEHCIIAGGETTVTLGEAFGVGGRNQEFALAAAIEMKNTFSQLSNRCSVTLLSCGSDGTDGPTDAAGAIVDLSSIISDNYDMSNKALEALKNHNAYAFLKQINNLVKTGPTNTNVMDIQIVLIENIM